MDILEFKNILNRMCDSYTCDKCPIDNYNCRDIKNMTKEVVEKVENWAKKNPIKTNRDKFKEVFGFEIYKEASDCAGCKCLEDGSGCPKCPNYKFWEKEYIEPSNKDCEQ